MLIMTEINQSQGFENLIDKLAVALGWLRFYPQKDFLVAENLSVEYQRMLGYTVESFNETGGRRLLELVALDEYDKLEELLNYKSIVELGDSVPYECQLIKANGKKIWVRGHAVINGRGEDSIGQYFSIVVNCINIDSQKRTVFKLTSKLERLKNALDEGAYYSYAVDLTTGYLMEDFLVQKNYYALSSMGLPLPCSFDELQIAYNKTYPTVLVEGSAKGHNRRGLLNLYEEGERVYEIVYYSMKQDLYLRRTIYMTKEMYTGHIYALVICNDITEEHKKEINLRRSTHQALLKAEELNNSLRREVNIVNTVSKLFYSAWRLNLIEDRIYPIVEPAERSVFSINGYFTIDEGLEKIISSISRKHRSLMLEELRLDTILHKLARKDEYELEFYSAHIGWTRMRIMTVERNDLGEIEGILFGWRVINEEKWLQKEQERQNHMHLVLLADYDYLYFADLINNRVEVDHFSFKAKKNLVMMLHKNSAYDEVTKRYAAELVHEDWREKFLQFVDRNNLIKELRSKDNIVLRVRAKKNISEREYFEVNIANFINEEEQIKVVIGIRCVDELLKAEERSRKLLQESNDKMRRALLETQKANEAKKEFLSRMSHDMRTPMNGILGMANIIASCIDDRERVLDANSKIQDAGRQLYMLINDVLDMSKLEYGNINLVRERIDLKKILEDSIFTLDILAQKMDVEIGEVEYLAKDRYIFSSRIHIQRIVNNIISNAIKYNRPQGRVDVTITEEEGDKEGFARFILTVKDNGVGMSDDFLKNHLFKPFERERADLNIQGTGLGMSIIKEIITLMGGEIRVDSKKGVGTVFVVDTQFEIADVEENAYESDTEEIISLKGRNVLIIDDNQLNQEIANFLLESVGVSCILANNGEEGINAFEAREEYFFDLILMDMRMPKVNGLIATEIIRNMDRRDAQDIPIIAMTANAFAEDKEKCIEVGMNAHLSKPLDKKIFYQTIKKYISKYNRIKEK